MKRFPWLGVTVLAVLALALPAWAEGIAWQNEGKKDDAAANAPAVDLKADLPATQYARLIKPIEEKVEAAQKAMEPYEKEMEKPADKRNEGLLLACKDRAASMYLGAALAARKAIGTVKEDNIKAAIRDQHEQPNKEKAISMLLELANAAQEKNDLRRAVAYFRRILEIDPENGDAKEGLTAIAKRLQEANKPGATGTKGGGSDDTRSWDRPDYSRTGRNQNDWSSSGRPGW